ncbi:MAG: SpvB/TcaC N-terminal domain-containing protein [Vicinamibacterales bacterium]
MPVINLPKGGGAIRGIGEKFGANPATGTGAMSIPIAVSAGRSGVTPQLALAYDSASGNGPFGIGWSLALPAVSRKTDKGLPRYLDAEESDVFLLSGAEDLVPVLDAAGMRHEDLLAAPGYRIQRYRPRTEGLFARIERWTRLGDGDVHWRSISRDNILSVYGATLASRVADPDDRARVFSWSICESRDDKGNAIIYDYLAEDGEGAPLDAAHQRNRGPAADRRRSANRYIKRIRYGNRTPLLDLDGRRPLMVDRAELDAARWMFEIVFDYGEHDDAAPLPAGAAKWRYRPDAFSSYRAGFEIRTCRLCRRILMFHHFADAPGVGLDCLVRSTRLIHQDPADPLAAFPSYSYLVSVVQSGHVHDLLGGYVTRSMPAVEFSYTIPRVDTVVREVDAASLENLPVGLDGAAYQWIDLHGEGLPGIVSEQAGAWFYARNLSPLTTVTEGGAERTEARFAPIERVAAFPDQSLATAQVMDLAGDGLPDLVVMDGAMPGLYEHDDGEGWQPFRPFRSRLTRTTRDPNARFVDLDGDGHADLLITDNDAFAWHPSLGEDGFGEERRVFHARDEEDGPRMVFAETSQSIFLADMSGGGLTDIVRVRNGEICYWPNLGYGRFGAKVAMDAAPLFDHADQFDARRLRLADIDGSGTSDLIYLHRDGVRLYFNESGNAWGQAQPVPAFPQVDDETRVTALDLLGTGTACLVWSSSNAGEARRQMRYVDLMGGQKPHLLVAMRNNLGAETRVHYVSSTRAYLEDKQAGHPWITRLPFPVHTVDRVDTIDHISGNRFVSRYAYHHGYFDGHEREFRGFGLVEQWDTDEATETPANAGSNIDASSRVPPVLTRTWFHTGVHFGRDRVSNYFADQEYYRPAGVSAAQAGALLLPDTVLPEGLSTDEEREACRALRGTMLRREVYAVDGRPESAVPYTVLEQNVTVRCLQRRHGNRHGVFIANPRESLTYHYERQTSDPRRLHDLTLQVDDFGNVEKSITVAYGRKQSPLPHQRDRDCQTASHITFTEASFTNLVDTAIDYRTPLPARTQSYEVTGCSPDSGDRYSLDEWTRDSFARTRSAGRIPYEDTADLSQRQLRRIEDVFTRYRSDDLVTILPIGQIESKALMGLSAKLALTPGLLAKALQRPRAGLPDEPLLPAPGGLLESVSADGGGYLAFDGGWWIPSSLSFFDPLADATNPAATAAAELVAARRHFFISRKAVDPFGHESTVTFDGHDLLPTDTEDAAGNHVVAVNDYRVLQPAMVTDANRNRTAARFDALGLPVATAAMGKADGHEGDELNGFEVHPALMDVQGFIVAPGAQAPALLGNATTRIVYDLDRFRRCGQPPLSATIARDTHVHPHVDPPVRLRVTFAYSDGFGREIQSKIPAEPGEAPTRAAALTLPSGDTTPGDLLRDAQGAIVSAATTVRWVGTGRTIFNNKGKPVRQYEPFFSATPLYEPEPEMTDTGVSSTVLYDPIGRRVATLHPNHTYDKLVFDAWTQATYDANDTVLLDPATDPDTSPFLVHPDGTARMPVGEFRPTWHELRIAAAYAADRNRLWPDAKVRDAERDAAARAAAHANTPSRAHLDALGRAFLTTADNGPDPANPGPSRIYANRVEFDIEGNRRRVRDARQEGGDLYGREVMRYAYDMLGTPIRNSSMEAGERWSLNNIVGKPIRSWDSRGFLRRMTYDELCRPTALFVTAAGGGERLAEQTLYGESRGDRLNHRGRVYRVRDAAGELFSVAYDFKGNPIESRRDLLPGYSADVDWRLDPAVEGGSFTVSTAYDALNRPRTVISPDASIHRASFNEANLLDGMAVQIRGSASAVPFVADVDYNAKGQRVRIAYGNGAETRYDYDPLTARLRGMRTTRPHGANGVAAQIFAGPTVVQELHYSYDPVGNLTRIEDRALKTVVGGGQTVEPVCTYRYDPIYRLIEGTGREHIGQTALDYSGPGGSFRDHPFAGAAHPNDLQAIRNYTQFYQYDEAGNFETMRHVATGGGWTRTYRHLSASLLEAAKHNNRLTGSTVGNGVNRTEAYTFDEHGNMTSMPHLADMAWDFKDQLQSVDLSGGGTAYYVYDAAGQRARKVIESQAGVTQKERIYIGGFEVYREFTGTTSIRRETLHVMDDRQRVAMVETATDEDGIEIAAPVQRYQLSNHLGSASVELAEDASLISHEEFHPYGTTALQSLRPGETSVKRYRFSGHERDEETGCQYVSARYYVPWLARWLSCDPSGIADGPHLYLFVGNRPVTSVDGTGRNEDDIPDLPTRRDVDQAKAARKVQEEITRLETAAQGVRKAMKDVESAHESLADSLRRMASDDPSLNLNTELDLSKQAETEMAKREKALTDALQRWEEQEASIKKAIKKMPDVAGATEMEALNESGQRMKRDTKDFKARKKARTEQLGELNKQVTAKSKKPPSGGGAGGGGGSTPPGGHGGSAPDAPKGLGARARTAIVEALEKRKTGQAILKVAPIIAEGFARAAPGIGIAAGAYGVGSELAEGNKRRAVLSAIGMSEIPFVSQTADIGLAVEDAGWAAKEILDPEQTAEAWYYETFLR